MTRLQKEFAVLDLDRDGKITLEELQTFLDNKVRIDPPIYTHR